MYIDIFYKINSLKIRAFVGLVILFWVLKKGHVEINEIWSTGNLHHLAYIIKPMLLPLCQGTDKIAN